MADNEVDLSEYNGGALVAVVICFLTLSWISVSLRTYTRAFLTKNFQLDDWLMLIAQAIFSVCAGFLLHGLSVGIGRHNASLEIHQEVEAIKWQSLAIQTYLLLMIFVKLSIGFFLLRLAAQMVYIWILRVSLGVFTVWGFGIFFWNIFQCNPVAKQWDYRIDHGSCVSPDEIVSAAYALTALTIVSDFLYALLPIPMLWTVKMSSQAKTTVIMILSLGIFASIATLVRIRFLPDMANTTDILYAGTDAMIWTIIEPGVAIVASSLATIRPLLRAMRIRGFESTDHKSTGNSFRRSLHQQPIALRSDDVALTSQSQRSPHSQPSNEALSSNLHVMLEPPQSDKNRAYMTVNGGATPRSTWSGRSETESMEHIHDLEAQGQESPRFGIGSDTEKLTSSP